MTNKIIESSNPPENKGEDPGTGGRKGGRAAFIPPRGNHRRLKRVNLPADIVRRFCPVSSNARL